MADTIVQVTMPDSTSVGEEKPKRTPLDWRKMSVVCLVTFVDPLQFGVLLPFIYFMVRDFYPTSTHIGTYVGLITSSFCLAQLVTALPWGWLSDRVGRKWVLVVGLLGNGVFVGLFGVSRTFLQAVLFRMACGALNGNVGVAKSVIGEITDDTNRSLAFSIWETAFGLGGIVGPALGGLLSHPADKIPAFRNVEFFRTHPYFLPCLVCVALSALGAILAIVGFEETLGRGGLKEKEKVEGEGEDGAEKEGEKGLQVGDVGGEILKSAETLLEEGFGVTEATSRRGSSHSVLSVPALPTSRRGSMGSVLPVPPHLPTSRRGSKTSLSLPVPSLGSSHRSSRRASITSIAATAPAPISHRGSIVSTDNIKLPKQWTIRSLLTKRILLPVLAYALWALIQVLYDETLSIFAVAPISAHGLGLTSQTLGLALTSAGVIQVFAQAVVYPPCEQRWGLGSCLKAAAVGMAVFVFGTGFVGDLTRKGRIGVVVGLVGCLVGRTVAIVFGYISIMIMINNSAPSPSTLGTVHGFGQVACSAARTIGPAFAGLLWTRASTGNLPFPLDFHVPFILMSGIALGCWVLAVVIERRERRSMREETCVELGTASMA
ncbi:hypothetical protein SpCBS45565_g05491 [Spizellomyces sp. 'palustris']|nr:hypothetical protein SpCBS45565_g05491 [Spizellomyces sp. 'palustris']